MQDILPPLTSYSHRDYLLRLARRKLDQLLRLKVSESDLVQNTLLRAHTSWETFEGSTEAELRAWLAKILHRQYLTQLESFRGTEKRCLSTETHDISATLEGRLETGSAIIAKQESTEALLAAISSLEPEHRVVIELRYLEQLTMEEVAQHLLISRHAAHRRWKAALKQLSILLQE